MAGGYFYNSLTGNVAIEHGLTGFLSDLESKLPTGWHGPFPTFAAVQAYAAKTHGPTPHLSESIGQQAGQAAGQAGSALTGGITDLLTQRSLWVRIVKVVLGLGLVVIGIIQLASPARTAGTIVREVVKA